MKETFKGTKDRCAAYVSPIAGGYLEKLGKFDLSTLSKDEWLGLIHLIAEEYDKEFKKIERIPF